ncbi:MAG: glycosyltransferase, partial [bacterium]
MSAWVSGVLLGAYAFTSVGLMVYGLHCYFMIYLFVRRQKVCRAEIKDDVKRYHVGRELPDYPFVTIQLPIYNEGAVVDRLIRCAVSVDYPADRLDVQVLDDSNDATCASVDQTIADLKQEGSLVPVTVFRRTVRKDFKAGALAAATPCARGEYLAMFDADFIIPHNFLMRTIPLFAGHPKVACVQTRWGHTNRDDNWLTRAQSVGIDGHFTAEQGARSYNSLCLNFNGSAGIWRKDRIAEAGGWQGDTLTEDLDLSYRAQLMGYRIRYDFDTECPAELPGDVNALKSQQRRWAKGSIETARKLIPVICRSRQLSVLQKVEAVVHLTSYFVALLMVILCLLALPLLW